MSIRESAAGADMEACPLPAAAPEAAAPEEPKEKRMLRDAVRCSRVEDSIYRRARGYKVSVKKNYKVKRVEYDPDTGKKTLEKEELQSGLEEVVIPADLRAATYWLINRDPHRWQEHPAAVLGEIIGGEVELPELAPLDEEVSPEDAGEEEG